MVNTLLVVVAAVLGVAYMMRRKARLKAED
jgi:hypothetical protein